MKRYFNNKYLTIYENNQLGYKIPVAGKNIWTDGDTLKNKCNAKFSEYNMEVNASTEHYL